MKLEAETTTELGDREDAIVHERLLPSQAGVKFANILPNLIKRAASPEALKLV